MWISSDQGIALIQTTFFTELNLNSSSLYIQSVIKAHDDTVLATDGNSVFKITKKENQFSAENIYDKRESLILSLASDGDALWIGYRDEFIEFFKEGIQRKITLPSKANRRSPRTRSPPPAKVVPAGEGADVAHW